MTAPQATGRAAFLGARDFLLRHREDYATAYRDFRWPQLDEFNWALDHFDTLARGNDAPALWIVDEDGSEDKVSFARMAERSAQVANWLRSLGVARGDRVLLLMPNEVALWETMLACMKLGAVIVPTTTLVSTDDLDDRFDFDSDVSRQRADADRRAGMAADLVEDIGEQVRTAIHHFRVIAEGRRRVDEAEQLDDAHDAAEIAGGGMHDGEQIEPGQARMLIGLLDGHILADLAGAERAVGAQRALAGQEDQPPALGMGDEVGDRGWRLGQRQAQFGEPDVRRHGRRLPWLASAIRYSKMRRRQPSDVRNARRGSAPGRCGGARWWSPPRESPWAGRRR